MRIELFGDEIDSMRWFSTFTQRSLGEAERVELAPAAELDAEHRGLAELYGDPDARLRRDHRSRRSSEEMPGRDSDDREGAPSLADALPLEHFRAPLDLIAEGAAVILARPTRSSRRCATTGRT